MAQLAARFYGIEEVAGSNPAGSTGQLAQWLARYFDIVEVTGSNPVLPTILEVAGFGRFRSEQTPKVSKTHNFQFSGL